MENQNHKLSSFWFGFLLGGLLTGGAAFLFGTKEGRKTLKKLLELSEDLEENLASLVEEYGEEIKEKISEEKPRINKPSSSKTIDSLLDKIKTLAPQTQKKVKRFFVKEGKLLEELKK